MLKSCLKIILSFILLLSFPGCAQLENLNIPRMLQSLAGEPGTDTLRSQADQLIDQGKSVEALSLLQHGIDAGIGMGQLSKQYIRALNLALAQADQYSAQQKHLQAGLLYRNALNYYPAETSVRQLISRTEPEVMTRIGECANQLLEDGLIAYRAGALEEAIDVWSQIRQFHPDYKASQQAIRTTRIQLKNLESVGAGVPASGS